MLLPSTKAPWLVKERLYIGRINRILNLSIRELLRHVFEKRIEVIDTGGLDDNKELFDGINW